MTYNVFVWDVKPYSSNSLVVKCRGWCVLRLRSCSTLSRWKMRYFTSTLAPVMRWNLNPRM